MSSCVQLHEDNDSYTDEWSFTIQATTIDRAVELINHLIDQKFALMPAEKFEETDPDLAQLPVEQRKFVSTNVTYIRKLLLSKHVSLMPFFSQLRLMPPSTNTGDSEQDTISGVRGQALSQHGGVPRSGYSSDRAQGTNDPKRSCGSKR